MVYCYKTAYLNHCNKFYTKIVTDDLNILTLLIYHCTLFLNCILHCYCSGVSTANELNEHKNDLVITEKDKVAIKCAMKQTL